MKKYLYLLSLTCGLLISPLTSLFGAHITAEAPLKYSTRAPLTWQGVVDYAREHLPCQGYLLANSDGFTYVKVDDDYIHALLPLLECKEEGYEEPPYFRTSEAPGAHISVFYAQESIVPEEIGQIFAFELKDIVIVKPTHDTCYIILQVDAPELELLRQKYGLSPKIFGHEYHISIAKKVLKSRKPA